MYFPQKRENFFPHQANYLQAAHHPRPNRSKIDSNVSFFPIFPQILFGTALASTQDNNPSLTHDGNFRGNPCISFSQYPPCHSLPSSPSHFATSSPTPRTSSSSAASFSRTGNANPSLPFLSRLPAGGAARSAPRQRNTPPLYRLPSSGDSQAWQSASFSTAHNSSLAKRARLHLSPPTAP
jgi:hypothetical protein